MTRLDPCYRSRFQGKKERLFLCPVFDPTKRKASGMTIDRSATAQALAKAIAFKQCGKDSEAAQWARQLVKLLECAEILA